MTDERAELRPPPASAASTGPVSNALIRVTRLHRARAQQLLRTLGLHVGQELLLMHLWEAGPQRPTELMRVFDTDSASMTRSVQRLERAGLVSREADPDDRRATRVRSTPAGFELRTVIEQVWADLEARTTAGMTDRQRAQLLVQLGRAEQSLSAGQQPGGVGVGTSARRATPGGRPGGRRPDPVPGAGRDVRRAAQAAQSDTYEAGTSA